MNPVTLGAEEAHYELQSAIFYGERHELPGASVFFAPQISDPDWNHAALICWEADDVEPGVAEIRRLFASRGLPATLVTSPFSRPADLGERLAVLGFKPRFRHTWHFLDAERSGEMLAADPPDDLEVHLVRSEDEMRSFVQVFERVYAVDLETGRPEALDRGYSRRLFASLHESARPGLRVDHYLATVGGRPAGTGTMIHDLEGSLRATGFYNLAVDPRFRRRGLAAALVHRRVTDALTLGQHVVFLQTERESVASWFGAQTFRKSFVFRKEFVSVGWSDAE